MFNNQNAPDNCTAIKIKLCDATTAYTKKFFMILVNDVPLGYPINDMLEAMTIRKWLVEVFRLDLDNCVEGHKRLHGCDTDYLTPKEIEDKIVDAEIKRLNDVHLRAKGIDPTGNYGYNNLHDPKKPHDPTLPPTNDLN